MLFWATNSKFFAVLLGGESRVANISSHKERSKLGLYNITNKLSLTPITDNIDDRGMYGALM